MLSLVLLKMLFKETFIRRGYGMGILYDYFECAMCRSIEPKSDQVAAEVEYEMNFPGASLDAIEFVCDGCYEIFTDVMGIERLYREEDNG